MELRNYIQRLSQNLRGIANVASSPWSSSSPMSSPMMLGRRIPLSPMMTPPSQNPNEGGNSITNMNNSTTTTTTAIPNIMLTMLEYYLILFIRFPLASPPPNQLSPPSQPSTSSSSKQQQPQGQQNQTYQHPSSFRINRNNSTSYGDAAYLHLFRGYLKHYLPHTEPLPALPAASHSKWRRQSSDGSEGSFDHSFTKPSTASSSASPTPPPLIELTPLNRDSELFLRLIIEFWLEPYSGSGSCAIPATTNLAIHRLSQRRNTFSSRGMMMNRPQLELDCSYDLAQSIVIGGGEEKGVPMQVQRGIRHFVNHLLSDPAAKQAVLAAGGLQPRHSSGGKGFFSASFGSSLSFTPGTNRGGGTTPSQDVLHSPQEQERSTSSGSNNSVGGGGSNRWCLTPSMTMAQPSFYNYVRMTFRYAPVHLSNSPFFSAFRAWLVWLEPWNVVHRKRNIAANFSTSKAKDALFSAAAAATASVMGGDPNITSSHQHHNRRTTNASTYQSSVTVPKPTSSSKYTMDWEPYIAANLHLYTVPLAIFLRRAREFDFSTHAFRKSLSYVQQVFRVFCPPVVETINRLLSSSSGGVAAGSGAYIGALNPLVLRHEQLLGAFRPPESRQGLPSCTQDAHNLLEEIFLQHQKTVRELDFFDRLASRLEGLAGQGMKGEEITLDRLVKQAKIIVNFPPNYEVLPNEIGTQSRVSSSRTGVPVEDMGGFVDYTRPERIQDGFLTDRGRQQILNGRMKCSALDVAFIGDPMYARVKSYEISFLVDWSVQLSNWMNCTLGLVEEDESAKANEIGDGRLASVKRFLRDLNLKRFIWFRINLRFIADYRNLIFICILCMSWRAMK
mmetsp:Transcript_36577/g.55966  ORF Transcript_36577/g.55966 Transcript_36577/m.55966 type:complete len:842 (+) Transcript_36577:3-2528(+)